ncbi:MAG: hypothetical protein LIP12_10520 [Clostridiales bacterium]|nr:hypothetical protein [Clostridiales bacterium]
MLAFILSREREIYLEEKMYREVFLDLMSAFDRALNRLENLGKIDINEHHRLDNEKNEHRVGKLLQSVGGNAKLNLPGNVIDIPYEYINYVIYNYNHNAIPLETLEKALECYYLNIEDISDIFFHTIRPAI